MTQPPEPPPPPDDAWPTPDDPTVISSRETVVGAPPPEPVGPPPDRRIGAGMLLALGALALVALGILIAWYLTHRDDDKGTTTVTTVQTATTAAKVAVPDLTGKTFPEAQATLDAAGLHTAKKSVSSDQPAGTVVDQEPEAGASVAKGSTVTLSVASAATSTTTSTAATTTQATTTAADDDDASDHDDYRGDHDCADDDCSPAADDGHDAGRDGPDRGGGGDGDEPGRDPRQHRLRARARIRSGRCSSRRSRPARPCPFHSHVQINVSKGPNATTDLTVPNAVGQTLDAGGLDDERRASCG